MSFAASLMQMKNMKIHGMTELYILRNIVDYHEAFTKLKYPKKLIPKYGK